MTATEVRPETEGLALRFDANTFARAWLSVALAASTDEARLALCGVAIEFFPTGARLVATDSYMLLRSWVPAGLTDTPEPDLDEAPSSTVVALDSYGRAESLMRHLLKITSGKDAVAREVEVGVGHDPRDDGETSLPGVEPLFAIFDLPGQEILTLRLFEGDYPDWRKVVAGFAPETTTEISFMPEAIVARLGKLGRLHADCPLRWRFGGPTNAAEIALTGARPSVAGLAMPTRVYLPHFAPDAEIVSSIVDAAVDAINDGALGPDVTASATHADGTTHDAELDDDYAQRLRDAVNGGAESGDKPTPENPGE